MEKKLQRNEQDQRIAGVCSGIADFFDIDVTWVRIAFVVALVAGPGILAYLILWIAVPKKPYTPDFGQFNAGTTVNGMSGNTSQGFDNLKKKDRGNFRLIAGVIFIFFGLIFLMDELDLIPYWMDFENLWPLILVGMGLYILSAGVNKDKNKVDVVEPEVSKTDEPENESTATDTNNNEQINPNTDDTTEKPL